MFVQRVVTGVSGSGGSLQALRYAAELASSHDAMLMPVLTYEPPGGQYADRRYPCPELRTIWRQAAWDRLWEAVGRAIGGPPATLEFYPQIRLGEAGSMLTEVASQPGDLLVIGAGRHGSMRRLLHSRVARYCVGHAACPVIAVPPSELETAVHGLRGWMGRHRIQPDDVELHADV